MNEELQTSGMVRIKLECHEAYEEKRGPLNPRLKYYDAVELDCCVP